MDCEDICTPPILHIIEDFAPTALHILFYKDQGCSVWQLNLDKTCLLHHILGFPWQHSRILSNFSSTGSAVLLMHLNFPGVTFISCILPWDQFCLLSDIIILSPSAFSTCSSSSDSILDVVPQYKQEIIFTCRIINKQV